MHNKIPYRTTNRPRGVYGRGTAGQVLVLDHIEFDKTSPLYKYPQPSFWVIEEVLVDPSKLPDRPGWAVLGYKIRGQAGQQETVTDDASWFYLVDEWFAGFIEPTFTDMAHELKTTEHAYDVLRQILVDGIAARDETPVLETA